MNIVNRVLRIINTIEDNLAEELNIDKISSIAYISTMQLYRDFYNLTGHSVKEYIRKRRLSKALALIKHSDMGMADIAYSCGYSSQQAFCKCVKNAIGLTPLEYKEEDTYYFFPRFSNEVKYQITVATEVIPKTLRIKYYQSKLRNIENRAINYFLSVLPDFAGRIFGRNGIQVGNQFCYELYVESYDNIESELINSEFKEFEIIPSWKSIFTKTTTKNIIDDVNEGWDYLYNDWLKNSMFKLSNVQYFEEYIISKTRCRIPQKKSIMDGYICEVKKLVLYLPIEKSNSYSKISVNTYKETIYLVSRDRGINAEANASKAVVEFLSSNHPYIIPIASEFYVSNKGDTYTCGIKLKTELIVPTNSKLELLHIPEGVYGVLEGECCGNSSIYHNILLSWIKENGFMLKDDVNFSIYETNGSFKHDEILYKFYIKINDVKNG